MTRRHSPASDDALLAMVHIPKTAGSTVSIALMEAFAARYSPHVWPAVRALLPDIARTNPVAARQLSRRLARGCPYVSRYLSKPALFDRLLAQSVWVSGHVTRPQYEQHLARIGRKARFATVLRDPVNQIASHYQWWIEIHHRGPLRYLRYSRQGKDLSQRIRATDNSDPGAIIAVLRDTPGLFLNLQTTYVMGPRERITGTEARAALARFEGIGLDRDVAPAIAAMTGVVPPDPGEINRSQSRFDRSIFRSPEILRFLESHHAADMTLYEAARDLIG